MRLCHLVSVVVVLGLLCAMFAETIAYADEKQPAPPEPDPLRKIVDMSVGETVDVRLSDGREVELTLLELEAERDAIRGAVRRAAAVLEVDGERVTLEAGRYHLPVQVGSVQIDCLVTRAYYRDTNVDHWALEKDARFRLWPADPAWIRPGSFGYPIEQRWFATQTQAGNVPVFVSGNDRPERAGRTYYHAGFDLGGYERKTNVLAATDGTVVSLGDRVMEGLSEDHPVQPRYDVIYIRDDRGWYYRYSHLRTFDTPLAVGKSVEKGQHLGTVGKEGASGGHAHLHFEIKSPMPSGQYGTEGAYAYLHQAYREANAPDVLAVARPHQVAYVGDPVTLDGRRSWAQSGIEAYQWTLTDGSVHHEPVAVTSYDEPGTYSEILEVTDPAGNVDYDFMPVHILSRDESARLPPTLDAVFEPTRDVRVGDPVRFAVRSFRLDSGEGEEVWDFGGSSEPVRVHSEPMDREAPGYDPAERQHPEGYASTVHRFEEPGDYIVTVRRVNRQGQPGVARLHVRVNERE